MAENLDSYAIMLLRTVIIITSDPGVLAVAFRKRPA